jgi:hypothetical protein
VVKLRGGRTSPLAPLPSGEGNKILGTGTGGACAPLSGIQQPSPAARVARFVRMTKLREARGTEARGARAEPDPFPRGKGDNHSEIVIASRNPYLPAASRPASSPVKSTLTRVRRGLSRNQAGEAGNRLRGTPHPNSGEVLGPEGGPVVESVHESRDLTPNPFPLWEGGPRLLEGCVGVRRGVSVRLTQSTLGIED